MSTIIIETKNETAALALINFLKTLDFKAKFKTDKKRRIEPVEMKKAVKLPIELANDDADFMALAGIWEGKNITLEQIRDKAWGGRL